MWKEFVRNKDLENDDPGLLKSIFINKISEV